MSPSVGHKRGGDLSKSPTTRGGRRSRSPPKSHRQRSPPPPSRQHRVSSHRMRSPTKEKEKEKDKDKHAYREEEHQGRRRSGEHEREKERHREKSTRDRGEVLNERSERRSLGRGGDKKEGGSSSRHKRSRSNSPRDRDRSIRPTSESPSRGSRGRIHDEVTSTGEDEHRDVNDSIAMMKAAEEALEAKKKEEPSFELSGKLAAETNRVKGVTLLFTEPSDARKPDIRWRLYVFKAGEALNEPLYIHRQTCYLFGRERRVADVPTDHPSCSKQHAVIQFRQVEKELPDAMLSKQVRPYLIDLGSTNGTFLNENRIDPQRYYELFEKDTIKFGNSSREYVILHENSV